MPTGPFICLFWKISPKGFGCSFTIYSTLALGGISDHALSLPYVIQDESRLSFYVSLAVSDGGIDMGKFQVVVKYYPLNQNLLGSVLWRNVFGDLGQIFGTKIPWVHRILPGASIPFIVNGQKKKTFGNFDTKVNCKLIGDGPGWEKWLVLMTSVTLRCFGLKPWEGVGVLHRWSPGSNGNLLASELVGLRVALEKIVLSLVKDFFSSNHGQSSPFGPRNLWFYVSIST